MAGLVLFALPTQAQETFTIVGTVTSQGVGLTNVTIVLSGEVSDTTTTGQNGEYTFSELAAGTYTVMPEHEGYTFAPESLTMTFPGTGTTTPIFEATLTTSTPTEADEDVPTTFALEQNYPNPFNPETVIRYQVAEAGMVRLDVVNLLGRTVAMLASGTHTVGTHTATFNGQDLPGGLYLYRLQAGGTVLVRRMALAK